MTSRSAAAALAMLAMAASPTPSQAAEKAIWGPAVLPDGNSAFALYERLGIDTLQVSMSWSDVAPARPAAPADPADPAYRWPTEQSVPVAEAAARGIQIALRVQGSPRWANGGRPPTRAPADPRHFADFLTAAARRYPTIRRWMIWDEPNRADRFQPNRRGDRAGPRAYSRLLDAAYAAIKRASSHNRVIGGMTWTGGTIRPPDFVRDMRLPGGKRPRLDWFGHNPFPYRFPDLAETPLPGGYRDISDSDTLSGEVRRAYGRRVPLWLSEYTIQSSHGSALFATFVSRAAQATYLAAAFSLADELGESVAGIGWLGLLDQSRARDSANWGVLTATGERKPAFAALLAAPSERHRPEVTVASRVSRTTLSGPGVSVRVTVRAAGRLVVELRRGAKAVARERRTGRAGEQVTMRLRAREASTGRYVLRVRAARGSEVRRPVTVL